MHLPILSNSPELKSINWTAFAGTAHANAARDFKPKSTERIPDAARAYIFLPFSVHVRFS